METIVALATPALVSALALIRVSGDAAFSITEKLCGKPLNGIEKPQIVHAYLSFEGRNLDEVVLLCFPANKSMTGEEVVEISCHGSPLIANEIIQAYLSLGARYAVNGEFTSRAFYNGKMDLIQAEAINDIINATTSESKNVAMLSLKGETSKLLNPFLEKISAMLALVEVGIDYPEYDEEEQATISALLSGIRDMKKDLDALIEKGSCGHYVRNGVDIALVGEPNVGKSSLLNALLAEDKAIVSAIPGTTRDVVEGTISLNGLPVRLFDTAGIRDTEDEIERLGVERSRKALEKATIVLLVRDERGETEEYLRLKETLQGKRVIEVANKSDLTKPNVSGVCYVSAKNGDIEPLKKAIFDALSLREDVFVTPSLSSERELALLRQTKTALEEAERLCMDNMTLDIVSASLQEAYNDIRRLLGLDATQDFGDEIFSRFCVGK